jgi:ATP-binding cassette subfamily B protein
LDGGLTELPQTAGEVEFRNVSFRYPNAEESVLHDISFKAGAGETVAFIGSTGCGKSTVINLIPRFYDATEGEILIDGVNVKDYKLRSLHDKIGYVPQRAVLFKGTIASNIAFGDSGRGEAAPEEIARAAETAQAAEFVEKLEDGFESPVSRAERTCPAARTARRNRPRDLPQAEIFIFDEILFASTIRPTGSCAPR